MVGPVEGHSSSKACREACSGPGPPFVASLEKWGRSAAEEREDGLLCDGQLGRWCRGALGESTRGAPMKGRRMSNTDGNPSCGAGVAKEADGSGLSVGKFGIGGKSLAACCGFGDRPGHYKLAQGCQRHPSSLCSVGSNFSVCQRCADRGVLSERLSCNLNEPTPLQPASPRCRKKKLPRLDTQQLAPTQTVFILFGSDGQP